MALQDAFASFAGGAEMDGRAFQKCVKDTGLKGAGLTVTDADLIFAKHKPKGGRKINFDEFLRCLAEVAARKNFDEAEVHDMVAGSFGPVFDSSTTQGGSGASGPERFFYDQDSYTGTHKSGGPTTAGSGVAHEGYADLSGLTRREHVQDDALHRRKHPSEAGQNVRTSQHDTRGSLATAPAQQGGRRSTLPVPGSVAEQSGSPRGGGGGSPRGGSEARQTASPRPSSPRGSSGGGSAAPRPASPRGSSGGGGSAPRPPSPRASGGGGSQARGPERFFYDQSTYTGVQSRAGGGPTTRDEALDARVRLDQGTHEMPNHAGSRVPREITRDADRPPSPRIASPRGASPRTTERPRSSGSGGGGQLRGPERFFYDKSTYTGTHTSGGPSTLDTHGASGYSDLSEMTRTGLGPKQGR